MLAAVAAAASLAFAPPRGQGLMAGYQQDLGTVAIRRPLRLPRLAVPLFAYAPPRSQGLWAGYEHDLGLVPLPAALRRPLRLPRLAPGAPCPVSEPTMFSSLWAPGLGPGPVYTVGFGEQPVLHYGNLSERWIFQKTMWPVAGSYTGPVRIRGHQIDGPSWIGFDGLGGRPYAEKRLPAYHGPTVDWRNFPGYIRVRRHRGCYALQIDGLTFSEVVVFSATP